MEVREAIKQKGLLTSCQDNNVLSANGIIVYQVTAASFNTDRQPNINIVVLTCDTGNSDLRKYYYYSTGECFRVYFNITSLQSRSHTYH